MSAHPEVSQILLELEEFFDDRMDADCVGDPPEYVPNEEMKLSYRLKELRYLLGVPE